MTSPMFVMGALHGIKVPEIMRAFDVIVPKNLEPRGYMRTLFYRPGGQSFPVWVLIGSDPDDTTALILASLRDRPVTP